MPNHKTYFDNDVKIGKQGERIFVEDFLEFNNIEYIDVSASKHWRKRGVDFITSGGVSYEVKYSYKKKGYLQIEENADIITDSEGWIYTTQAEIVVFVSPERAMIMLRLSDEFHEHYKAIKDNYETKNNRPSTRNGIDTWQSSYKEVPISDLKEFCAYYKKAHAINPQ